MTTKTYWNEQGLYQEFVPLLNVEDPLIAALFKLYYEYYNNGNVNIYGDNAHFYFDTLEQIEKLITTEDKYPVLNDIRSIMEADLPTSELFNEEYIASYEKLVDTVIAFYMPRKFKK